MNADPYTNFERPFRPGDQAVFGKLTQGLVGELCTRGRGTFAGGLILDFGALVSDTNRRFPNLPQDRGESVLSTWGCDVVGSQGGQVLVASRKDDSKAVTHFVSLLVGSMVEDLMLEPADLSLTIVFSNTRQLELRTDPADPDLDQWFIELPNGCSVGASASGRWHVNSQS